MRPRPAGWLPVEPGAWGAACPASGSGSRRRCGDGPGGPRASLYWQPSTLGPESGKEAACQEFRQFWGDRSQLRRFQDGSVKEMVVWGGDREEVVGDIVQAVLAPVTVLMQ